MTTRGESFLAVLTSLWLRLSTVCMVGLLFLLALGMPGRLVGWSFYLSPAEEVFEMLVYAIFVALASIALGAICAAAVAPLLFYRRSSRLHLVETVTRIAVGIAAFVDLGVALNDLVTWAGVWGTPKIAIVACYCLAFAVALRIRRSREQVVTSLDGFLGKRATRRAVLGTGIAAAALGATEAAMGMKASALAVPRGAARPAGPNILLVTFDALSAEDMSLYGYRLPTTPHIDEFARQSSVFTNAYSASTFTTPCVATILSGLPPSEHRVYHISGRFLGPVAAKTLPHLMRAGGYSTGASVANIFAYSLVQAIAADYDALPDPAYRATGFQRLWDATAMLHQRQPFGSRGNEFWDLGLAWDYLPTYLEKFRPGLFAHTRSDFPPVGGFEQALGILGSMPDRFFLWVHILAPHWPYLPDANNLGRFLRTDEMRTQENQSGLPNSSRYTLNRQDRVDKLRLRYDEFIANADNAFGDFLSKLDGAGRRRDTAVILAADHGESFQGGVYGHKSRFQTRPEIHIPLIIRMPGQERGSRVAVTVDQTSLAPTILEIAGVPRPDWMRGESLVPWLHRDNEGEGQGMAFTQYLERDSIFKPVSNGTVGVIDGRHQYVLNLATGKGILRSLAEAHLADLDRSAENPALAQSLREAIYARFPDLPRKRS